MQLLAFRFGPDSRFEGQLVGALERLESGGTLRVRDVLHVRRDAETGELEAVAVRGDRAGGLVAQLVGFRLDATERRRATRKALGGAAGHTVEELGAALAPGEAMALVLVEHVWARVLEDAVGRVGGTQVLSEFVDATALTELTLREL